MKPLSLITMVILAIVLPTLSCNKKPKPRVEYPDPALMAKFDYKPGTWWVYRDSISGNQDSFAVTTNGSVGYAIHDFIGHTGIMECAIINQYHNGVNLDTFYWQLGIDKIKCSVIATKRTYSLINMAEYVFSYGEPIDHLDVNGTIYHNVYDCTGGEYPFYFNDEAGIIKFKFYDRTDTAGRYLYGN